jgi:archaellum component FlaC
MTDTQILQEVLKSVQWLETRFDGLETRFDGLEKKVDKISTDLTDFREHMEGSIDYLGKLSNQAFAHINEIRAEVVSPWKINNSK